METIAKGMNKLLFGGGDERGATSGRQEKTQARDEAKAAHRIRSEARRHAKTTGLMMVVYALSVALYGFASLSRAPVPALVSVVLAGLWVAAMAASLVDIEYMRKAAEAAKPPTVLANMVGYVDTAATKGGNEDSMVTAALDMCYFANAQIMMVFSSWVINLSLLTVMVLFGTGGREAVQCAQACCLSLALPFAFYWALSFRITMREAEAKTARG